MEMGWWMGSGERWKSVLGSNLLSLCLYLLISVWTTFSKSITILILNTISVEWVNFGAVPVTLGRYCALARSGTKPLEGLRGAGFHGIPSLVNDDTRVVIEGATLLRLHHLTTRHEK